MRAAALLLAKDLRTLRRSPALLGALVAYPLLVALLVAVVAAYANAKPRVAFVDEDDLPAVVEVGGSSFDVDATIREVARNVELVEMGRDEAERELATGRAVAAVTIPGGFLEDLQSMSRSPVLELRVSSGALAPRVTQQMQALVFQLNRALQDVYVEANLEYVELLLRGGSGSFLGRRFDVLGLAGVRRTLDELPRGPRLDAIREFVGTAELALGQTGDALEATAHPIRLREVEERGRTWALSAQVQAYALAVTLAFVALLLGAGALAAERDELVAPRLLGGLVRPRELLAAKLALSAVAGVAVGIALVAAFGAVVELARVEGGQPWARLPLVALGLGLAGAAFGALGSVAAVVARDARTASLVAVLGALPIVFLGLVPREVAPALAAAGDATPFGHAYRFFVAALFDDAPLPSAAREAGWLAALAVVYAVAARVGIRRLVV